MEGFNRMDVLFRVLPFCISGCTIGKSCRRRKKHNILWLPEKKTTPFDTFNDVYQAKDMDAGIIIIMIETGVTPIINVMAVTLKDPSFICIDRLQYMMDTDCHTMLFCHHKIRLTCYVLVHTHHSIWTNFIWSHYKIFLILS